MSTLQQTLNSASNGTVQAVTLLGAKLSSGLSAQDANTLLTTLNQVLVDVQAALTAANSAASSQASADEARKGQEMTALLASIGDVSNINETLQSTTQALEAFSVRLGAQNIQPLNKQRMLDHIETLTAAINSRDQFADKVGRVVGSFLKLSRQAINVIT